MRRERKERGRERRGGEGSWNRAADWLRPALVRGVRPNRAANFPGEEARRGRNFGP